MVSKDMRHIYKLAENEVSERSVESAQQQRLDKTVKVEDDLVLVCSLGMAK